jgi:autotransporter-associated beta strand protein
VLGGENNFTLPGAITGASGLSKVGSRTVTLSGSNSYTGATIVSAGVLLLNSANALPGGIGASGGTSNLQLGISGGQNDGVVGLTTGTFARNFGSGVNQTNMQFGGGFAAYAAGQAVNLGGASGTQQWGQSSFLNGAGAILVLGANDATHAIDFQNPINMFSASAARTIKVNNGQSDVDAIMSGVISNGGGSGGLTKTGSGVLSLTAANTYTGTTTISAGTLQIGNNGASGSIQASSPVSLSADAALAFNRLDNYGGNFANAITGSGLVRLLSGSLTLSGSNNYSGGTEVTGGRLTAGHANAFGTSGITISAGALDLANLSISNAITNNGGVLTGLAAYSGTQSVSGLTSLSGNVGGTVNVLSSGTLKGSNTNFTGAVAIATGGVHSPGSSPGVQTFESGITYDTGSTLAWELVNNTTTGAGTAYDIVNVTGGSLSIASGALLQLEFQNTGLVSSAVDWTNSFWDSTQSWMIVDFLSNTGNSTGDFTLLGSSSTWLDKYGVSLATARNNDATFQLSKVNGDVVLTYVIVPEPDTIIFAGIGIALAGWTVWKRRRIAQITARTK